MKGAPGDLLGFGANFVYDHFSRLNSIVPAQMIEHFRHKNVIVDGNSHCVIWRSATHLHAECVITVSCSCVLRLFHILKTSFCFSVRFSELPSWKNCDNVTPKAVHIFSSVISDGRFSCAMILPSDDWEIPDSCDNLYLLISRFSHKDVILSAIYFSIYK